LGLDDWVADDDAGYLAIAKKFASSPHALAQLRQEMPGEIVISRAGNGATYTRAVEEAYRSFWQKFCGAEASVETNLVR
jgi:predicted O-linked N-acetylglucosamine transferase (SPINDLY family)